MPVTGPALKPPGPDPDRLLAAYRDSRAHQQLFPVPDNGPAQRQAETTGYDEFMDAGGEVRPAWRELADVFTERGHEGLTRLRDVVRSLVDDDGITFTSQRCFMHAAKIVWLGQHIVGSSNHQRKGSVPASLSNSGFDAFDNPGLRFAQQQLP